MHGEADRLADKSDEGKADSGNGGEDRSEHRQADNDDCWKFLLVRYETFWH